MNKFVLIIVTGMLVLFCANDRVIMEGVVPTVIATIYEPDGTTPAPGVTINIFDADDKAAAVYCTDYSGRYSIADLPDGEYRIRAEKDTFVLFLDSVLKAPTRTTLRDGTLECPSSLHGSVGVQSNHDPRTVTILAACSDKPFTVIDEEGTFTLTGLARGTYSLLLTSTLPGYIATERTVTIACCSHDTIHDALQLIYTGIPVVSGVRVIQDTLSGAITVSWEKTSYKKIQDYMLYRDIGVNSKFSKEFFSATGDTFFIDSIYVPIIIDPLDTAVRLLEYRIAIRNKLQEIGPVTNAVEMPFAPKARAATFFTHHVRHALLGCDSASIGDTVELIMAARNMTRPLRTLVWYDLAKKDAIATLIARDTMGNNLTDTIRRSFDSVGTNRLLARVIDNSGTEWFDTIPVKIVKDPPQAFAGLDTGVFTGDTIPLRGAATQQFGTIAAWEWKIGAGAWNRTARPEIAVVAPASEQTVVCSLAAIDDDNNRAVDEMKIITSHKVQGIAASWFHSLILKIDGSLWACGSNDYGQLGDGTYINRYRLVPVMTDVRSMATGWEHSLILKTDGSLWACGADSVGQLGNSSSTTLCRSSPVQVMTGVRSMAAGDQHSLVLTTDGSLWAFGYNRYGQLGDSTLTNRFSPVQVMTDVRSIATGGYHSLILKTDGTLWACGYNKHGQLGDGTNINRPIPVRVMTDVQNMAGGYFHSLILKTDGTLWACGDNSSGQLGNGTNIDRSTPIEVMTNVQGVSAGISQSLFLKTDGTLWTSGTLWTDENGSNDQYLPVQMTTNVQSAVVGFRYSLILKTDGSLWACGDNFFNQLGDYTSREQGKPIRIIPWTLREGK